MKKVVRFVAVSTVVFLTVISAVAEPKIEITNVQQRYPWNGIVDIGVSVEGLSSSETVDYSLIIPLNSIEGDKTTGVTNGVYSVQWNATQDFGTGFVASNVVLRTVASSSVGNGSGGEGSGGTSEKGVQLWAGGPYWMDRNVGATAPEDPGLYFWWGDTVGYKWENNSWVASDNSAANFSFSSETSSIATYNKSASQLYSLGYTTTSSSDAVLNSAHDAATVHWGNGWRMPTIAELNALVSNCTSIWTTRNGFCGGEFFGKGNFSDRSIFIPAAGYGDGVSLINYGVCDYVWSSSPNTSNSSNARRLIKLKVNNSCRYSGIPVRAVRDLAP